MKKFYHVSEKDNLCYILKDGLIPKIGDRSTEINEKIKRVYLFPSKDDMDTALSQWLGEWFLDKEEECGHEISLMSLEITLPDDFPIKNGEVEYEKYSLISISPKYIKYLKDE